MALIKSVRGFTPKIGENCYLADNATIIGDVVIGKDCSIWFNAVLRGDVNAIRIGNRVNIQDGSVVHTLYQKSVVEIGNDVSVGHNVTIHGATIKETAPAKKKVVHAYNRQVVFQAKTLQTDEDIDDYVEKIRSQLKQLLKNCDEIKLN